VLEHAALLPNVMLAHSLATVYVHTLSVQINEEAPWFCDMHPDPAFRSCTVPEEEEGEDHGNDPHANGTAPSLHQGVPIIIGQVRGRVRGRALCTHCICLPRACQNNCAGCGAR